MTVEGIIIDPREVGTGLPFPSDIKNMLAPIVVSPLVKITSLREEQIWKAKDPTVNEIETIDNRYLQT